MKIQLVTDNVCVNLEIADDQSTFSNGALVGPGWGVVEPPPNSLYMHQEGAGIGWTLANGVLSAPTPPAVTLTKEQLGEYANAVQWGLATSGHNVTIGGQTYLFPTDAISLGLMTGKAVRLQQPTAPTSVDWQFPSGYVSIAASDFMTASANIADWVQSTFEALKPILAAIQSGAITNTGQIDAASWPAR